MCVSFMILIRCRPASAQIGVPVGPSRSVSVGLCRVGTGCIGIGMGRPQSACVRASRPLIVGRDAPSLRLCREPPSACAGGYLGRPVSVFFSVWVGLSV